MSVWDDLFRNALNQASARGLLRTRTVRNPSDAIHLSESSASLNAEPKPTLINFASNDYLGLSHHPRLIAAAHKSLDQRVGSGAAPLVTGYSSDHVRLEKTIAQWKQMDDSILLPSGYQANHAAIGALTVAAETVGKKVRFLLDKLVHASIVDAVRASQGEYRIYPHNSLAKLRRLLTEKQGEYVDVVVTESIFSMDGDAVDLEGLVDLKKQLPFLLLLDEAHATGVYGPNGAGYAAERGLTEFVDLSVITFSKSIGIIGGAVAASTTLIEAIVNFGRAYLFSTSIPPHVCNVVHEAIAIMHDEPHRRMRVRKLAKDFRGELSALNFEVPPGDSPIIPLILGDEQTALDASLLLKQSGFLVVASRPPTVPKGSSRLRITLSSEHDETDIHRLLSILKTMQCR